MSWSDPKGSSSSFQISPLTAAISCFSIWGLLPIFWKSLATYSPMEMFYYRTFWSALVLLPCLLKPGTLLAGKSLRCPQQLAVFMTMTSLIGFNMYLFIYGVQSGRIIETSLGYFLTPLASISLGLVFLQEKLSYRQKLATFMAGLGILLPLLSFGSIPWVTIGLAGTFSTYVLFKKYCQLPYDLMVLLESALLFVALTIALNIPFSPLRTESLDPLLVLSGPLSVLPLWLFAKAAKGLPLSTLGFIQFLAPSLQFILGLFVYDEVLTALQMWRFVFIWMALGVTNWPDAHPDQTPVPRLNS